MSSKFLCTNDIVNKWENGLPELACATFPAVVNPSTENDLDYFPWKSIEMLVVLVITMNTVTQCIASFDHPVFHETIPNYLNAIRVHGISRRLKVMRHVMKIVNSLMQGWAVHLSFFF